jgi:predicted dehydrogenase
MTEVAVLGLGMMGRLHSRILSSMPDVRVVAVEIDPAARESAERELGLRTASSLDEVLAAVDAVVVTLPDHLHVEASSVALQAGKPVMVEKPLATSVADGQRILDAQSAPGRLMVAHVLRFDPRLVELKRRIDSGELGDLRYVRIHRANTTASAERLGGRVSVTAFLGVHDLDLLLWLTGRDILDVTARGRSVISAQWDVSAATLAMSGDLLAVVENHWLMHPASARSCIAGVEVFGSRGMATLDLSTDEIELTSDEIGATRRVDSHNWSHDPSVASGALRREAEAFVDCVRSGSPMPISGEDGLRAVHAVELVESALRSTAT